MDEIRHKDELRRRQEYLEWKARKLPSLVHLQRSLQRGYLFRDVIRREQERRTVGERLLLSYPAYGDEEAYDVTVQRVYDDGSYDVDLTLFERAPELRKPGLRSDWTVYRQELMRGVVSVEVLES